MALIQISETMMVNSDRIETVEIVNDIFVIVINGRRFNVEENKMEILAAIKEELNTNELMRKNAQHFGG